MTEMTQEQMIVKPEREDDGWFRIAVIATVDGECYRAVAEYRHDSEGPVVKSAGRVIPGYRISRIQSEEGFRRELYDEPREIWPPRMPGTLPVGMHTAKRQG